MRLCEFKQKEVINEPTCNRLGYVSDIEFDVQTGQITHIIVPGPCKIWGILGREEEYIIDYRCICKVGADIILVNINEEKALHKGA
ncbi:PRC-barrel domain-containing protein [Anaerolentibacter hominis]|uniref:PRC-barrel domain-containing protein n=1 Tax=Anaerolentibacter hominis TaxID=3079009 RepID=UPI0031B85ED6